MIVLKRIHDSAFMVIAFAIVILTIGMSLVVFSQIVLRYIVDQPFSWTEELARVTFLLWTLLGAILAYKEDKHMGLNIVEMRIPEKPRLYFILFKDILVLVFCAVMFWQGVTLVSTLRAATPILRLPFSKIYLILPFMMACIFILCLIKIVGDINRIRNESTRTNKRRQT
jgi:TRAP-type C4-dicarboxylate transport system permease small subunit